MTVQREFEAAKSTWPLSEHSQFVSAGRLTWHVQHAVAADHDAPRMLLLHGTGASTHSMAPLFNQFKNDFHILTPDLPGHGFTEKPATSQLSIDGMSHLVAKVCEACDFVPDIMVGHSAGAAIAANMTVKGLAHPKGVVSIAGAFLPIGGANNSLFSLAAKLLASNPFTARIFAWRARDPAVVRELMERTGSTLRSDMMVCYEALARNKRHVSSALGMMANWSLQGLVNSLPDFPVPMLILTGTEDQMIPAADGQLLKDKVPQSEWVNLPARGHLLHEEAPEEVAGLIREFVERFDM